jgi:hypothetical protein
MALRTDTFALALVPDIRFAEMIRAQHEQVKNTYSKQYVKLGRPIQAVLSDGKRVVDFLIKKHGQERAEAILRDWDTGTRLNPVQVEPDVIDLEADAASGSQPMARNLLGYGFWRDFCKEDWAALVGRLGVTGAGWFSGAWVGGVGGERAA